ncbi:translation initiation factor IF-2 [Desulfovibrio sp. SGI.169]|uniref:translation initiation factor IF-2 n=1 Tax=Desulfovibrio sp. SGI.169 TaxID=3420561 RepID=UPI003D0863AA
MRRVLTLFALCAALCAGAVLTDMAAPTRAAQAASALSPRHSGLEPPGGPRPLEGLPPASAPSRTAEGGMGYTDAYGNTVEDRPPEEKAPRKRPRPGAYGSYGVGAAARPLPDPDAGPKSPAWSFK